MRDIETPNQTLERMLGLTVIQRIRKKDRILSLQGRSQKGNQELFAIKVASLRGKWVAATDDRLRCTLTARLRRPYRRLTIQTLLEFTWVDGQLRWTAEYLHECEYCAESKKGCKTVLRFIDGDGYNIPVTFLYAGYDHHEEGLDLPRRGLSLETTPAFDDPAHADIIFGWSKHEVDAYLGRLRHRRQEQAEAVRAAELGQRALDHGIGERLRAIEAIHNDVGDAAEELSTSVGQQLAVANRQRHLANAGSHVDTVRRALFEGIVGVVRANPLLPLLSTSARPTGMVVVLTDEATHGQVQACLNELLVADATVPEHFRARPLPAPGAAADDDDAANDEEGRRMAKSRESTHTIVGDDAA